ncbi:MAG TPA: M55 family metallopeptidase [Phycisphaerae bacterium]|nr:M55 family metallopeptidase [Phycisphaerae bacterium]HOB73239.1 M55 family metallopeptidase [Phycisphaerae bacterium]HOJ54873.1 M55 family metallopeptidase [Phycisphaerae bacterium]HOL26059.1 M55 family metallopeptidase [Phycisphaerae bacterium]HPP21513.1 M55 family metallopeptidase [Phycisphaerae bacterium]
MNIFISADIEGIGGVMGKLHADPEGARYQQACEWMVEEVNAAVRGALAAGAQRIVVKDAHDGANNIPLDRLHPAAELISGWGPLNSMVEGVDTTFNAVFLIGYHPRAHTVDGTLAHTWSGNVLDFRLNGEPIGESAWAAAFAGHFDVPVALVTGDERLKAQLDRELPAGFEFVATKTGLAFNAARMRPIAKVREDIEAAARSATVRASQIEPLKPRLPVTLTVRFRHWEGLNICACVPGVERLAADTFQCVARDMMEAQKYFVVLHRLARPAS